MNVPRFIALIPAAGVGARMGATVPKQYAELLGKPAGQDATHGRPSSAGALGLTGAVQLFDQLIAHASASIPACRGSAQLRTLLRMEAKRLVPNDLVRKFAPSVTRVVA